MKKMIVKMILALMAGAFTFAANAERWDSYAAYGTITYNNEVLTPASKTGWLRDAINLGSTGWDQKTGCIYEGAVIKATKSGVVRHDPNGTYPHFWCDMTYDVRGCTVIGSSIYYELGKTEVVFDSWCSTIFVSNRTGRASMRVTVLADDDTRLGAFEYFPEVGTQIVCDRPVTVIRAQPGTTTPCDWANGIPHYGAAWYYADPNSPAQEPVYKNDGLYYYSEVKPVSLTGSVYDRRGGLSDELRLHRSAHLLCGDG